MRFNTSYFCNPCTPNPLVDSYRYPLNESEKKSSLLEYHWRPHFIGDLRFSLEMKIWESPMKIKGVFNENLGISNEILGVSMTKKMGLHWTSPGDFQWKYGDVYGVFNKRGSSLVPQWWFFHILSIYRKIRISHLSMIN